MLRILLACYFAFTLSAQAMTSSEQEALIENIAILSLAEKWCTSYQIDKERVAKIAMLAADISKEPQKTKFFTKRSEVEKIIGESGTSAFCMTAYKVFGPGGEVSGFMMRR